MEYSRDLFAGEEDRVGDKITRRTRHAVSTASSLRHAPANQRMNMARVQTPLSGGRGTRARALVFAAGSVRRGHLPGGARESRKCCRRDPRPDFWMQCRSCQALGGILLGKYGGLRAGHAGYPHRRENPHPSRSPYYRTAMLGLSAVAEWGPENHICMCPRLNTLASLSAPQGFSSFPTVLGRTFLAPPHHFCAAVP